MSAANMCCLERSFQPYLIHTFGCSLALVILTCISLHEHSWAPLLQAGWIFVIGAGGWVFLGTRYRIAYSDEAVVMRASGMQPVTILFCDIAVVQSEASIERGRPFRRIAIYPANVGISRKWIDISMKHFVIGDIQNLLAVIREKRPDLTLPTIRLQ